MSQMRSIILSVLLFFAVTAVALAQSAPNCNQQNVLETAATTGPAFNATSVKCVAWTFSYFSEGFSVISIQVESAPDVAGAPGTFVVIPGTNITNGTNPLTSTVSGSLTINGYFPWLRVNLTTATGTGSVNYTLIGNSYVGPSSSVTAAGGVASSVNLASVGGGAIAIGQATKAASLPVVLASDQTAAVKTQPNVPACTGTPVYASLQTVPTSATAISWTGGSSSATTCVTFLVINNTTTGALAITVTDGQGSPVGLLSSFSIPANSQLLQPLYGLPLTSGVKWTAGGSGLTGGGVAIQ